MQRQVPSHVAFSEAASGESSVDLKVEKKKESSRSASSSNMATPAATANEEQRQKQEKAAKKSRLAEPEPVMEEESECMWNESFRPSDNIRVLAQVIT